LQGRSRVTPCNPQQKDGLVAAQVEPEEQTELGLRKRLRRGKGYWPNSRKVFAAKGFRKRVGPSCNRCSCRCMLAAPRYTLAALVPPIATRAISNIGSSNRIWIGQRIVRRVLRQKSRNQDILFSIQGIRSAPKRSPASAYHRLRMVRRKETEPGFSFTNPDSPRVVEVQCRRRGSTDRRERHEAVAFPAKMVTPTVDSRIEEQNELPGRGVTNFNPA
jgi:hypothetical protein